MSETEIKAQLEAMRKDLTAQITRVYDKLDGFKTEQGAQAQRIARLEVLFGTGGILALLALLVAAAKLFL